MKRCGKQNGQVLIILVSSLFLAGGAGSATQTGILATGMTLDTIQSRIDEKVFDPQRKKALSDLVDQWETEGSAYFTRIEDRRIKLLDFIEDHDAHPDEFREFLHEIDEKNNASDNKLIDIRFAMRKQMSRNEWEAVFKAE